VLGSLTIRALVALKIGVIIPFASIVNWALIERSERKKGYEKSDSFRKSFDEDSG
jgi:hypothetical protein